MTREESFTGFWGSLIMASIHDVMWIKTMQLIIAFVFFISWVTAKK